MTLVIGVLNLCCALILSAFFVADMFGVLRYVFNQPVDLAMDAILAGFCYASAAVNLVGPSRAR